MILLLLKVLISISAPFYTVSKPHKFFTFRHLPGNLRILVKQTDWCYKLVDIDSIIEKINTFYYIMNVNFVYIIDSNCNKF